MGIISSIIGLSVLPFQELLKSIIGIHIAYSIIGIYIYSI